MMEEITLDPALVAVKSPQLIVRTCPALTVPVYWTQEDPMVNLGLVILSPIPQVLSLIHI